MQSHGAQASQYVASLQLGNVLAVKVPLVGTNGKARAALKREWDSSAKSLPPGVTPHAEAIAWLDDTFSDATGSKGKQKRQKVA